jgi:hypothetical protein
MAIEKLDGLREVIFGEHIVIVHEDDHGTASVLDSAESCSSEAERWLADDAHGSEAGKIERCLDVLLRRVVDHNELPLAARQTLTAQCLQRRREPLPIRIVRRNDDRDLHSLLPMTRAGTPAAIE